MQFWLNCSIFTVEEASAAICISVSAAPKTSSVLPGSCNFAVSCIFAIGLAPVMFSSIKDEMRSARSAVRNECSVKSGHYQL